MSTEDAAVVQFETDARRLGTFLVSQISAGRKNRLRIELDGAGRVYAFDQEAPEALWVGATRPSWCAATPTLSRRRRAPASLRPAIHRATRTASTCSSPTPSRRSGGHLPDGMPRFADGLRAAQITDAVLASAREQRWVDVPGEHRSAVVKQAASAVNMARLIAIGEGFSELVPPEVPRQVIVPAATPKNVVLDTGVPQ